MNSHTIDWIDAGREPECQADPKFPDGVAVDLRGDQPGPYCRVPLIYPAPRVGHWRVSCTCGYSAIVTAAGRRDDPSLALIPCKAPAHGGRLYTEDREYPLDDAPCRRPARETEGD